MKITNIADGPRGINTVNGPVLIDKGQTIDADVTASEHRVSSGTGWFDMKGDPVPDGTTHTPTAEKDEEINRLKALVAEREREIATLKAANQPETDIEKMTVAELKTFLTGKQVAFTDENKADLLELARKANKAA